MTSESAARARVRCYLGEVAASQSPTGGAAPSSIIKADQPIELTVCTEVRRVHLRRADTGKRRNAAEVLTTEGEQSTSMLP